MCFLLAIRQDLWPLKVWPSFLPRISNHRQTNALPRKPLNWQLVLRTDYDWKWVEQPKLFDTKKLSSRQRPVEPMEGARVWKGPMRTGLSIGTLSLNPQPVELAFEMPAGNPDHLRHRSEFSQCGKKCGHTVPAISSSTPFAEVTGITSFAQRAWRNQERCCMESARLKSSRYNQLDHQNSLTCRGKRAMTHVSGYMRLRKDTLKW